MSNSKNRENPHVPDNLSAYLGLSSDGFGKVTADGVPFAQQEPPDVELYDPTNRLILTAGTGAD